MTADPLDTEAIRDRLQATDWRQARSNTWCRGTVYDLCDEIDRLRAALASTEAPESPPTNTGSAVES